jgi:hypothetical protein
MSCHHLGLAASPREIITCTVADTDVAAGAIVPADFRAVHVTATAIAVIAYGEATTAAKGAPVALNCVSCYDLSLAPGAGDQKIHAQSPTAGAKVYVTYMR